MYLLICLLSCVLTYFFSYLCTYLFSCLLTYLWGCLWQELTWQEQVWKKVKLFIQHIYFAGFYLQADWVIERLRTSGTAGEANATAETTYTTGASAGTDEVSGSKTETGAAEAAGTTSSWQSPVVVKEPSVCFGWSWPTFDVASPIKVFLIYFGMLCVSLFAFEKEALKMRWFVFLCFVAWYSIQFCLILVFIGFVSVAEELTL